MTALITMLLCYIMPRRSISMMFLVWKVQLKGHTCLKEWMQFKMQFLLFVSKKNKSLHCVCPGRKVGNSCQGVPKTCSLLERYPEATGCKRGQVSNEHAHCTHNAITHNIRSCLLTEKQPGVCLKGAIYRKFKLLLTVIHRLSGLWNFMRLFLKVFSL